MEFEEVVVNVVKNWKFKFVSKVGIVVKFSVVILIKFM